MAMIANLGNEELDKMCQEMSDCIENNTFDEVKIIQALHRCHIAPMSR